MSTSDLDVHKTSELDVEMKSEKVAKKFCTFRRRDLDVLISTANLDRNCTLCQHPIRMSTRRQDWTSK
ncbi:Hypothetical predicted protein [Xyrichtys novacula]|uniref:Uncharacterized protein n=1 Tax=Xyrichtys novacula TaxID=13765 RepID=A0AAV1GH51_XYRNO|nr:Hypothetical predicted protein [Xyrichtys novacula]